MIFNASTDSSHKTNPPTKNSVHPRTQRIVGAIFFLLIAFLFIPHLIKSKPPKITTPVEAAPHGLNIDAPLMEINLTQDPLSPSEQNLTLYSSAMINTSNDPQPMLASEPLPEIDFSYDKNESESNVINNPLSSIVTPNAAPQKTSSSPATTEKVIAKPVQAEANQTKSNVADKKTPLPKINLVSATKQVAETKKPTNTNIKTIEKQPKQKNTRHVIREFVVQAGVFSQRNNAELTYQKLKASGYPAYIQKIGQHYKVHIGPYKDEVSARKIQQRLKKSGQDSALIKR